MAPIPAFHFSTRYRITDDQRGKDAPCLSFTTNQPTDNTMPTKEKAYTVGPGFIRQYEELWDFYQSLKRATGGGDLQLTKGPNGWSFYVAPRRNNQPAPRPPLLVNIDTYTQANGATWHQLQPGSNGATVLSGGLNSERAGPAYEVSNAPTGVVQQGSGTNGLHVHLMQGVDAGGTVRNYFINQPRTTFPVKVTKTGGSDGTASTAATWVYTVKDLAGNTLGTSLSPAKGRPNGKMAYAPNDSYGVAFYDGATLKLWDVNEIPTTGGCP